MTQHFISRNEEITLDNNGLTVKSPYFEVLPKLNCIGQSRFILASSSTGLSSVAGISQFEFDLPTDSSCTITINISGSRLVGGAAAASIINTARYSNVAGVLNGTLITNNFHFTGGGAPPALYTINFGAPPTLTFITLLNTTWKIGYVVTIDYSQRSNVSTLNSVRFIVPSQ